MLTGSEVEVVIVTGVSTKFDANDISMAADLVGARRMAPISAIVDPAADALLATYTAQPSFESVAIDWVAG
eukprot:gene1264-biopygen3527